MGYLDSLGLGMWCHHLHPETGIAGRDGRELGQVHDHAPSGALVLTRGRVQILDLETLNRRAR